MLDKDVLSTKIENLENEVSELKQLLVKSSGMIDDLLTLQKEQMDLLNQQRDVISKEEDIVKILNYIVWKIEYMDSKAFNSGVMQNMFAGMIIGG